MIFVSVSAQEGADWGVIEVVLKDQLDVFDQTEASQLAKVMATENESAKGEKQEDKLVENGRACHRYVCAACACW